MSLHYSEQNFGTSLYKIKSIMEITKDTKECFRYLGIKIIHKDGEIKEDVTHRIRAKDDR
jgi:hypothetical protein